MKMGLSCRSYGRQKNCMQTFYRGTQRRSWHDTTEIYQTEVVWQRKETAWGYLQRTGPGDDDV